MPSTNSSLSLSERKEKAFTLFTRGYTTADVAREIGVSPDTAGRYRKQYEDQLDEQAQANPSLLRDVLHNTLRSIQELDQVRREAWESYEEATSDGMKVQFLNTMIKAQDQRNKLFGLMGVKQDYFLYVNSVRIVQDRMIDFMRRELCDRDRRKLEHIMRTELAEHLDIRDAAPVIDIEAET